MSLQAVRPRRRYTAYPPAGLSPQERLVIAILQQAATELLSDSMPRALGARRFICSDNFDMYCEMIGANAEYIRLKFVDYGWLPARYLPVKGIREVKL